MMRAAAAAFVLACSSVALAQPPAAGQQQLMSGARFVDTTVGQWRMTPKPELVRKPDLHDLETSRAGRGGGDFGLSFNCSVEASGKLTDCRPIYAIPAGTDGPALTRALSPFYRLSKESAATAREKAYRVTIDAARTTFGTSGMPRQCLPPFCIIEGALPPPPPPVPEDPTVRAALDQANKCFETAWEESRVKRFAAEKAVRDATDEPGRVAAQAAALDYVHSRQKVMACITDLEKAGATLPLSAHDRDAVGDRLKFMRFNYSGQTRYEISILVGLLDKNAGAAELSFSY
ncbi:MAG TPA: hypothetical protein VH331_16690 [Allosphingosinicella sp.]|nr:hypothetical protein [Allosphingosinicella sp.]